MCYPGSIRDVKLSVSLADDDVELIDRCVAEGAERSRSAVVQRALRLLRASRLGDAYAEAWDEWAEGDGSLWESTAADGLTAEG